MSSAKDVVCGPQVQDRNTSSAQNFSTSMGRTCFDVMFSSINLSVVQFDTSNMNLVQAMWAKYNSLSRHLNITDPLRFSQL